MKVKICSSKADLGASAAAVGIPEIQAAIAARGSARVILATGASQFEVVQALVDSSVDWSKVTLFHLDEYCGLKADHGASFRNYMQNRFVAKLKTPPAAFHFVNGDDADGQAECDRLKPIIAEKPIDVAFIGIGENGHLAFNDPPCDLETKEPFIVVTLDEACRQQQVGEGWFKCLDEVPTQAISMSMNQILAANTIVCSVPDARKADAVQKTVNGPITADVPASTMQTHKDTHLLLDVDSAAKIEKAALATGVTIE